MKFFYRLHGILVDRLYINGPSLVTKVSLWAVRWILDRYEMWQMRHYFRQQELIIKKYDLITKTCEDLLAISKDPTQDRSERIQAAGKQFIEEHRELIHRLAKK